MQIIGQMIGDARLVQEGKEEERQAETEATQEQPLPRDQPRPVRQY
jgi:hypothetical protein